ncbi:hypothetical protein [Flexivirga alba]|uniref:Uncharacterized protein n=1 Tax=Flexivirga alba TaxID=702742 RepID=A0ABW2ANI2_9MICO
MPSAYFLAVRAVVNGEDPVGLLGAGAPVDEYDPEVTVLVEQRFPVDARRVHDVFAHYFGDVGAISGEAANNIAIGASRARREHPPES